MFYLGIDFGTSGARAIVIDNEENIVAEVNSLFNLKKTTKLAQTWGKKFYNLLNEISLDIRKKIDAIAINGTSSTVLLCDVQGNPIDNPIWYNDKRGIEILDHLKAIVPVNHLACSPTSSLAKLFWWYQTPIFKQAYYFLHQADWLGFLLHGKLGISDYHNALKLGYDVENFCYPDWLKKLPIYCLLPQVLPPGTPVKEITPEISQKFNLNPNCLVYTGTTDSIAAFLASGVEKPGEAVTSLGSTLVLKLLSTTRIEDYSSGIYSHRLGNLWLTGGASNTGGAVLKNFFDNQELDSLSDQINWNQETKLNYYPLLNPGERFPINAPNLAPQLEPKPDNKIKFLQGLLEGIAKIEALGYQKLQDFGATTLSKVYTAGGGAKNEVWRKIRERYLKVPVIISQHTDAAYGTALLAKRNHLR
ncbi:MAG TPA: carbohydrate kinase [Cyanothece sp. UBA12306]|nr:carbohydrate kinase [Cyanothece sp. UBA12306]